MTSGPQPTMPKRFYKTVGSRQCEGGFEILLDDKLVHTPARTPLKVEAKALAHEIVAEWEAQGEKLDPATMPMTKRANTAIDRVQGREPDVVRDIVSYAATDLLCYRAASPEGLIKMQCDHWDPVLQWSRDTLDAPFETQTGISHIQQAEASLQVISRAFEDFDYMALTPLHTMTTLTGSALLVLALAKGELEPEDAWAAAHVEEDWQISQWGEDAEAAARREVRRTEFDDDVRFLQIITGQKTNN